MLEDNLEIYLTNKSDKLSESEQTLYDIWCEEVINKIMNLEEALDEHNKTTY